METPEQLLRRAQEVEALASVVSYGPDKERLMRQAAELRRKAEGAAPAQRR